MRFALLVSSSRAMCPPKDVIGIIGIRCENTKQSFTSFTSSKQRRRNPAKKDTIVIDFGGGGGGKKKSRGQNVDDDVKVVERGGGGEKHCVTQKGSRRSTFIAVAYASCAFFAQGGGFLPNNANAGSGGWGDCAPVCDALKDGFSAQQKMQEEMLRLSLATMNTNSDDDESGGGDDGSEKEGAKKKSDKVDFAQKSSEREKRKKNSTTRRQ